jgi:hypothetical protein
MLRSAGGRFPAASVIEESFVPQSIRKQILYALAQNMRLHSRSICDLTFIDMRSTSMIDRTLLGEELRMDRKNDRAYLKGG